MVIFSMQNYTTQTTTPILDAKLGEHYAFEQNYTTHMTTPILDAKLGEHYARLMHWMQNRFYLIIYFPIPTS